MFKLVLELIVAILELVLIIGGYFALVWFDINLIVRIICSIPKIKKCKYHIWLAYFNRISPMNIITEWCAASNSRFLEKINKYYRLNEFFRYSIRKKTINQNITSKGLKILRDCKDIKMLNSLMDINIDKIIKMKNRPAEISFTTNKSIFRKMICNLRHQGFTVSKNADIVKIYKDNCYICSIDKLNEALVPQVNERLYIRERSELKRAFKSKEDRKKLFSVINKKLMVAKYVIKFIQ